MVPLARPWTYAVHSGSTGSGCFISAIMQVGLALPMAYYFHRATTAGLPANLIVVPLTQLMMPAAIAALGTGFISLPLAKIPALLTTFAINCIAGSVHSLGALRMSDWRIAMPSVFMIGAALAALVSAIWCARLRGWLVAAGGSPDRTGFASVGVPPSQAANSRGCVGSNFDRCR